MLPDSDTRTYLCRDCLMTFPGPTQLNPGAQCCNQCLETTARVLGMCQMRQFCLEEMGFNAEEVKADLRDWYRTHWSMEADHAA